MNSVLIFLLAIIFLSCNNSHQNDNNRDSDSTGQSQLSRNDPERSKDPGEQDIAGVPPYLCPIEDFIKLKDRQLQSDFFRQLDSVRKTQYPENDQDIYNLVDLTPAMLNKFLNDINVDSLQKNGAYEGRYFFNIAPKGYTDSRKCDDMIIVRFFTEDCGFRMIIDNVYPVEEQGCAGGAQVIYGFRIIDNRIVGFGRQAAG